MKAREAAVKDWDAKLKKHRDRLGALEQELEDRKVELDSKARVLAEDRVAFAEMEEKARTSLKTLYESGLESRFPSWFVLLKMSPLALALRLRPRRASCLLQR